MSVSTPLENRMPREAWLSFLLGLASVGLLLLAVTGIPALLLGLRALRAVNASDGRLPGRWLAITGMVLGSIGTVVTLFGLCVLTVRWLRISSERIECTNNLRQLGNVLNGYADLHGAFPPATREPRELAPDRRLSWYSDVVPLLGEAAPRGKRYQNLAEKIDRTHGWEDPANRDALMTHVRLFLCPAYPEVIQSSSPGRTTYVGMAGINPDAITLPRDDPRAGMFGDQGVARRQVSRGISFTMMVLETEQEIGPWLAGGFPTVRGLNPNINDYSGFRRPFGGLHPGVVNVLWVDGSVRAVNDHTSGEVFRSLARIHASKE